MATAAVLLLGACSSPAPDARPTVNFGPGVTVTPGMPGMTAMPSMSNSPAGTTSSAGQAAPVAGNAVNIDNFAFAPASLTVPVGSTVTWTNHDEEPHTIAANDGSFHSPGLGAQGTYSYTFRTAGTFDYICSIHPFMHGT